MASEVDISQKASGTQIPVGTTKKPTEGAEPQILITLPQILITFKADQSIVVELLNSAELIPGGRLIRIIPAIRRELTKARLKYVQELEKNARRQET